MTITRTEFEVLEHRGVLEQLEAVENVKVILLGEHERVGHELRDGVLVRHSVERVGGLDLLVLLVADDGRRQIVEAEKIGDRAGLLRVLDDVGPDDFGTRQEPVGDLFARPGVGEIELAEVGVEECGDGVDVALLHRSETGGGGVFVDAEQLERAGHGHARLERREAALDQLLRIDGTVPVARRRDGLGQHETGSVLGLKDAGEIDAARDLENENGRESVLAELLVDAEKVDLDGAEGLVVDARLARNGGDDGDELLGGGNAHAEVPVAAPARRFERPGEKCFRIVEAKHVVVVFDIVRGEQRIDLVHVCVVQNVEFTPFERIWQSVRTI